MFLDQRVYYTVTGSLGTCGAFTTRTIRNTIALRPVNVPEFEMLKVSQ